MSQPIKLPKLLQEGCVLQRGEKKEPKAKEGEE